MNRLGEGLRQIHDVMKMLPSLTERKLVALLLLISIRSLVDVVGLASAYPIFALLAHPESFAESGPGRWIIAEAGVNDAAALLLPFVAAYAFLLAVSALMSAGITILTYRFIYLLQNTITTRMLSAYLYRPYEFFLQHNVSFLAKNINVSVSDFSAGLVLYMLFFISTLFVFTSISIIVFIVDPLMTALAGLVLASIYTAIVLFLRPRIARWGVDRDFQMNNMFKCVEEALTGIKDVKISGSERVFIEQFEQHAIQYAGLNIRFQTANSAPSQLAQAAVMLIVALTIVFFALNGKLRPDIIPFLGVFYLAFSRLLPLGNQLYANWATVTYFWPSIERVHTALCDKDEDEALSQGKQRKNPILPFKRAIRFDGVHYRYPSAVAEAVKGVSFEVGFGQMVALVGRSGAGKSTLVDLVLGLVHPVAGTVSVDEQSLTRDLVPSWRQRIGYVPQFLFLFDGSLAANIAFGVSAECIDYVRLTKVIKQASLEDVVACLPEGVMTRLGDRGTRLSGGERQRVGIARALYREPGLLVLDEATSALDVETERAIFFEMSKLKGEITMVIVTHRSETLANCDHIIHIDSGCIVSAEQASLNNIDFSQ